MRLWKIGAGSFIAASAAVLAGCGGGANEGPPPLRQNSTSYAYVIKPDDSPPHAREDVHYTVQILDRKTRQPIENGEGQLYASRPIDLDAPTGPHSKTWDGLAYRPENGMYQAKLNFVVAGQWAVAIRFRRDSLHQMEKIEWMQDVLDERPDTAQSKQPTSKTP